VDDSALVLLRQREQLPKALPKPLGLGILLGLGWLRRRLEFEQVIGADLESGGGLQLRALIERLRAAQA
jgi:hypothetical protein